MTDDCRGWMLAQNFVMITAESVIMTVLYNGSGGVVPLAILFYWLSNLYYPWEADLP